MQEKLEQFSEKILRITANDNSLMGGSVSGMFGRSAEGMGANAGTDITLQLKAAVVQLRRSVHARQPINELVKQIEGYILSEIVVGVLLAKEAYGLIDELRDIVKGGDK